MPSLTPLHETQCQWKRHPLNQADLLEGCAQLASSSLKGVSDIIQLIYREILQSIFGMTEQQSRHFLKIPYVARLQRCSFQTMQKYSKIWIAPSLRYIVAQFPSLRNKPLTVRQCTLVGIINGILGDYLLEQNNPLAQPMLLYDHYGALQRGELTGRIVIFVHGLCMNHTDWTQHHFGGIGERLLAQRDNNYMLYLDYNTGRRISSNGHSLADLLQDVVSHNPRITSIDLIGHSMGGLVLRSALFYGKQNMYAWTRMIENLVCIGSPHHGAVLERLGFALQEKVGRFPFIKILSHLGNLRSNGILDLRYGSVRDDDWEYLPERLGFMDDRRKPAPLPSHIKTFFIAGTVEHKNRKKSSRTLETIGDYLVSIKSALGEHINPQLQLKLPEAHKAIFYGLNHLEIRYHPDVSEQITRWLYPDHDDTQAAGVQQHVIDTQHYTLDDLKGIVET